MEWVFRNESGKVIDPNEAIFPLTSHDTPDSPFRVIGTAFMIAKPGIFLTARHCLYKDANQRIPWAELIGITHHALPVRWVTYVDNTDVAIGQLEMLHGGCATCEDHKVLTLCTFSPIKKERICHWGCDLTEITPQELDRSTFHLKIRSAVRGYNGHFIEKLPKHPPFTHSETYVTSAVVPPAASGGPVILSTGQVCGISTSSSDAGGYSVVSLIGHAMNANVPPHFRVNEETKGRTNTFGEVLGEFGIKVLRGE